MQQLQARVDLGAMAMKGYSLFPKASDLLVSHHQIALCHMLSTHVHHLQRLHRCILQPQPTGPAFLGVKNSHLRDNVLKISIYGF